MTLKKLHICIVTYDYPSSTRSVFTFVEQMVTEFADMGARCSIIAPFSITKSLMNWTPLEDKYELKTTPFGNKIEIFRPRFISFSKFKLFGISLSSYLHKYAVNKVLQKLKTQPDVLYSHFWFCGIECYNYALINNVPLFVATGESIIPTLNGGRKFNLTEFRNYVSGVICVSAKNKVESIEKGLTYAEKCIVLPNGVDLTKFQKKSKNGCRKALGYNESDFIVAFVGHFNERKGSRRLESAINFLNDNSIKSLFIGSGPLVPECYGILFRGRVDHVKIADYLNCADVFVLPTLHEGCCNAIIEAMACGLPIISSDLLFNVDILNDENSILLNPNDIRAIANAIKELKDNSQKRARLSNGALNTAKALSIKMRAEKILNFIKYAV